MITYQVEKIETVREETAALLSLHWQELGLDHERIPLDADHARYEDLERQGILHIVTVRDMGKLVGYHIALVTPHLHYKSTLHAITDIYFLLPEYRQGRIGIKLFQFVEQDLRARGVKRLLTSNKLHLDIGKIFDYLGYKEVERLYSKYIGS